MRRVALKTEDVTRSLFEHLESALKANDLPIHRPGERYDGKSSAWMEARILAFDRGATSRNARESHQVRLSFVCYRMGGHKGQTFASLDALVDRVRLVVDSTASAPAMRVLNGARTHIATLDFGPAGEERSYSQTINVDGVAHPGCDVATLVVSAVLSAAT